MTIHPATTTRCFALCLGVLATLGLIEYALYPDLSWRISDVVGGGEADGSTMRYFLDVYVVPGLGAFLVVSVAALALAAKKNHRTLHVVLGVLVLLNAALFASSSIWYYRATAEASGARTPRSEPTLESEMRRLGVRSALIVPGAFFDEHPVWSRDNGRLAFRTEDRWKSIPLAPVRLVEAKWMGGQSIGVASPSLSPSDGSERSVKERERHGTLGDRKVIARDGTTVELKMSELGTALIVTKPNLPPETVWSSEVENCHSPSLSPDQRLVAYICEQDGLIVTAL